MNEIATDSADEAQTLRHFTGTPEAYVDLISENWSWTHGKMIVREMTDQWMAPYWEIWLVTGGWSENEETLDTLEGTWFYRLFWESTHRGGLMVFHVPAKKWTETMELGKI